MKSERVKWFAIGIISVMMLTIISNIIYRENKFSQIIPIVFSEISQIKREQGTNLGAITEYYATINDACMKVFEANNLAQDSPDYDKKFASELEIHIDPSFKEHRHNLPILWTNIYPIAQKALDKLQDLNVVTETSGKIYSELEKAWVDKHYDVYKTETYTYETTDSKGNTTTHTGTREVYDYTIHTYNFNKEYAEKALVLLYFLWNEYSTITIPEKIYTSKITHAEGEYATEKSFRHYDKKFTTQDAVKKISSWANSTTYNINMPIIISTYPQIKSFMLNYIFSISTSRYHKYNTRSSTDDGPKEFQINENMKNLNKKVYTLGNEIVDPIKQVLIIGYIDEYYKSITNYVSYKMDNGKTKIDSGFVIKKTKEFYFAHFKGSTTSTFNTVVVILKIFVVLIIGSGIIFLIYKKEGAE